MISITNIVDATIATAIGTVIAMKIPIVYRKWKDYFLRRFATCWDYMPHKIYNRRQKKEEMEELVEAANPFNTED